MALLVASLAALLFYLLYHTYAYITPPALIYIPDRNSTDFLLESLKQQNIPLNILDYRLLRKYPYPKSGWVRLDPGQKLTRGELIQSLLQKPREKTRRIVMYEGMTLDDFAAQTARQTRLSAKEIATQYRHFSPYEEGGILAGYYQIPYRTTAQAVVYYIVLHSEQAFQTLASSSLGGYDPKQWRRILIIASIIQKETHNTQEMPLISSVIHNRLTRGMKLQLDATLNYDQYSHTIVTPERIREDKSDYNTYRHKGLPPHPLGSSSKEAILAALHPAKTDYLYFMLADDGSHNFAASYPEHLAHIRWYNRQKEQKLQEANRSIVPTNQQFDTIPQHHSKEQP